MNKLLLIVLVAVLIICTITVGSVFAQIAPELPGNPDQAPIDGGLALLAAAGGGYAIKKLRDRKK